MNTSRMTRRILAAAAAGALGLGLVACSQNTQTTEGTPDATVTSSAVATQEQATETEPSAEASTDAAESADTAEVTLAGGETETVPGDLATAIGNFEGEFGKATEVKEDNGAWIAEFENGDHVVYSEETGAVPLVGKIGETWFAEGGANSAVGLPTAPEKVASEAHGWTQSFQHGQISWLGENGTFSADIQTR
ncbi:hypothetical protein CATYP_03690 [Corynebacterium atypicum]|uniref:LGFP repeat-containing protein n=1 Tax=Corynebacterium atypicum TaxID=191610 RepID=A0ABN4DBX1_9CORY|nr:hypothetical protein [Corynebacterium atypicum]AIG63909.1 hypothetical protein CATYP_03690 [Corynebacterium atypicum]